MSSKIKHFLSSIVALMALLPIPLFAQADIEKGELVPLEQLKPLVTSEEVVNTHGFNVGLATLTSAYYEDTLEQTLILGFYRPYLTYLWQENHLFTLRGKWAVAQFTEDLKVGNSTIKKEDLSSSVGSLEVASAEFNLSRQKITAGRAFYRVGRGLVFANFADGAEYSRSSFWGEYKILGIYSAEYGRDLCALGIAGCGGRNPYDVVPGRAFDAQLTDAGKRFFGGFELTSAPLLGSRLGSSFFYSKDLNTAKNAFGEQFTYNPWYASLGARGFLGMPSLRYLVEYVYQGGETTNRSIDNKKGTISAHALQADVSYNLPWLGKIKPLALFQYAFGSGDADRSDGTNAAQVNRRGQDTGFYYFGAFSGGLALKPRLHNLHVARVGFIGRPLADLYALRNLQASLKYSLYRKVVAEGPISDARALEDSAEVGQGFDITLAYDFRSDVKFFYAYGLFSRGNAYAKEDQPLVQVHLASATINF